MLSDYRCRVFDVNKFNFCKSDPEILKVELARITDDIALLATCGYHKFICHLNHNQDNSVTYTRKNINSLKKLFSLMIPKTCGKINLKFYPSLYISPDAPYIKNIELLAVRNTNYIFLELPLINEPEYLPGAVNKILYNCKLLPIFLDFQIANLIYASNEDEVERLINIKGAAYQFGLKSIVYKENIMLIKEIMDNGNTVLLGTDFDHSMLNKENILYYLEHLKRALPDGYYQRIIIDSHKFI